MKTNEELKSLYFNSQKIRTKHEDVNKPVFIQFFRGKGDREWKNQHVDGCTHHLYAFKKHNIIPEYCFNCYKILIQPRTVVELFKLMVIFEMLKLPNDNTRKCMVERRENISGAYKGFIYCRGKKEVKQILPRIRNVISKQISKDIPVTLKRGCSCFSKAYPEYGQIGKGKKAMEYKEEWRKIEKVVNRKSVVVENQLTNYNHPSYNLYDAQSMHYWLRYAATIGDLSYLSISDVVLQPLNDLKRFPFNPADD